VRLSALRLLVKAFFRLENAISVWPFDTRLKVTWCLVKDLLAFGSLKMQFLKGHESRGAKISGIHRVPVRHFGGLKMRFFKGHEALGRRVPSSR
jgi:hypothetical protein